MSWSRAARVAAAVQLLACGEIERAELLVRPSKADYAAEIQPIFESLGCSASRFCHATAQGNLLLVEQPTPSQLEDNFLGAKAMADLDAPDKSPLLASLLQTEANPQALHNPACFSSRQSCAYRKIRAWIAWAQEGDPRPQDVPCTVEAPDPARACADPGVLDACCPRH